MSDHTNARDFIHALVASRNLDEIRALSPEQREQEHLALRLTVHELMKIIQTERDTNRRAKSSPLLTAIWDRLWRARELE